MTWRSAIRICGRSVLSCGAVAASAWLLANGPYVAAEHRGSSKAAKPQPLAAPAAPAQDLTLNGLPIRMRDTQVAPCDAATWDPLTAGYCAGHCTPLTEQRTAQGATFAWHEEATGSVHSLTLSCPVPGGAGTASQFSLAASALSVNAAGWTVPAAGPLRSRTTPVPGLPGATEVVHLESGGLTLFVDRPPSASTALEELQLVLFPQGWRVAGGPALRLPENAAPTRVFVRGAEVYVVTLEAPDDDSQPLLVSAYSRYGWAPEAPQ
jgi:hypothetical protein